MTGYILQRLTEHESVLVAKCGGESQQRAILRRF